MEYDRIEAEILHRAERRRLENPEIEAELERLTAFPKVPPTLGNPNDATGTLEADLHLANLQFNPCQIAPKTRLLFLKRLILRISRVFMTGQIQFNAASVRVLNEFQRWIGQVASRNQELEERQGELESEVQLLRSEQADLLEMVRVLNSEKPDALHSTRLSTPRIETLRKDLMGSGAFPNSLGFLERFRGSEEEVTEQQRQYLELFRHCGPVVDIGCGRGEFLSLLTQDGVEAWGIENDPTLAAYLRSRRLPVKEGNLFEVLSGEDEESIGGIFGAQIIEHLTWDQLRNLLILAREKLAAGGILLLESLNPCCLSIYAESLYLDPTHVRPYHPSGIAFLCENLGFSNVEIRYSSPVTPERRIAPFSEHQHFALIARR